MRTPEETFRAMLDAACRLQNGDRSQVDSLAEFYAEETDVRHPTAPLGDTPLRSREALRQHFAAAGQASLAGFRVEDIRVHHTADPEVVIGEFTYRGDAGWSAPNIIVFRIRDGVIVESRDYIDHLGLARATNTVDAICAQLTNAAAPDAPSGPRRHPRLDPQLAEMLARVDAAGVMPLVRGTAQQTRERHRALMMARRGPEFVPETVAEVRDDSIPGGAGQLPVRVYVPAHDRGRVVTYLHGGGFVVGDLDTHDPVCRRVANALGAVVVSVGYRLGPEHRHPAAVDDTLAGLAWSRDTFPERVGGIAGDSAGATLAAIAALAARGTSDAPAAQLLLYPQTDPTLSQPSVQANGEGYLLTRTEIEALNGWYLSGTAADASLALLDADVAGAPAAVVATAQFDPLRDEGDAYAAQLAVAGVPVRHLPGPGLIHGWFALLGVAAAADAQAATVLSAFDELLGG